MFSLKAGSNNIALTPLVIGPAGGIININPTLTGLINVTIGGLNLFGASVAVTTPNTDLYLTPPSGASVSLRGNGYVIPLKFYNAARTYYVGFQTTTLSGNTLWTLPPADGTANQALLTNGSGILSWGPAGGVGTVTSISQGSNIVLSPNPITTTGSVALSNTPSGLTSIGVGNLSISGSTIDNPTDLAQIKITNSIVLAPDSTDPVFIGGGSGSVTPLAFNNAAGTFYSAFQAGALTSSTLWTLPLTDGGNGDALITNGSGVLSWTPTAAGSVTSITQGTNMSFSVTPITTTGTINLASTLTGLTSVTVGNITLSSNTIATSSGSLILNEALNMNTHQINNLVDPTSPQDGATKNYVDSVASGLNPAESVVAASTANLTATYANGSSGVGATLTNSGTMAAFSIDGQSPTVGQRVLIKNQSSTFQNGIYTVTVVGNGSTNWVLTRATDFDTPSNINSTGVIPVINGTVNGNTLWLSTATVTTVGTDPIIFTQFAAGTGGTVTSISQGTNMNLSPNPITTTGTVNLDSSLTGMVDIEVQTLNATAGNLAIGQGSLATNTVTIYGSTLTIGPVCNIVQPGITSGPSTILPTSSFFNTTLQGTLNINVASFLGTAGPTNIGSPVCPTYLNNDTRFTNGSFYNQFSASGALAANVSWLWPLTDSTGTQFLQSDGAGNLSWGTGASGTVTSISQGSNIVCTPNPITSTGTIALSATPSGLTSIGVGNYSIASNTITNTTGAIILAPHTTSAVQLNNGTNVTPLQFYNAAGTFYSALQAGNPSANVTWTLPLVDGSANQFLKTNGSGVLSFAFDNTAIFTDLTNNNQWPIATAPTAPTLGTAIYNTAFGVGALTSLTTGYANTAFGGSALTANTTGIINTAIGFGTLISNTTGQNNTAVGGGTLAANSTGGLNTGLGGDVLPYLTTGSFNTAVGYAAGGTYTHLVTGSENTLLGYGTGVNADPATNRIVIGYNAEGTADNTIQIGSVNMDFCHNISALATSAAIGFTRIPSCAGVPTGTPASINSTIPVVYDSTDSVLYVYNSAWHAISGTGTVTSITQGTNMSFSTSPITTTGTINLASAVSGLTSLGTGTLNATGLSTLAALNQTGATNINISGTAATTIGNGTANIFLNGNVEINYTGSGATYIGNGTLVYMNVSNLEILGPIQLLAANPLQFYNPTDTFYVAFKGGAATANTTWTLPLADGSSGEALVTNGSGTLSWSSTGVGSVTSISAGASGNIVLSPNPITTTGTVDLNSTVSGLTSLSTAALTAAGTVNLNATGSGVTTIGTGGTGAVDIGNATGNTAVTGKLNILSPGIFEIHGVKQWPPYINKPGQATILANTWINSGTSPSGVAAAGMCWAPQLNLFVAVNNISATTGAITSPDGITWTARTVANSIQWFDVCWSPDLGLLCAVGNGSTNAIMTSPDGIAWTFHNAPTSLTWRGVCWSPELQLFCAVAGTASTSSIITSPDGQTWTTQTISSSALWTGVCWSPELGIFVAVGNNVVAHGSIYSSDGINWTFASTGTSAAWQAICWAPELGKFIAVNNGTDVITSTNPAVSWTLITLGTGIIPGPGCIAYSSYWSESNNNVGLIVIVGTGGAGRDIYTSTDAVTFTLQTNALPSTGAQCIGWSPDIGRFCVGTKNTNQYLSVIGPTETFGNVTVAGNETISGTLGVTGTSTLGALTQAGTANINNSGSATTNIGNSTGTLTELGATIAINDSGAGTTNIAYTSGTGNTNIGNGTGGLTLLGDLVTINNSGTGATFINNSGGSAVYVGNSSYNSTITGSNVYLSGPTIVGNTITSYDSITTAGLGFTPIVSVNLSTAVSGNHTFISFTTPAAGDTEYTIHATVYVTSYTSGTMQIGVLCTNIGGGTSAFPLTYGGGLTYGDSITSTGAYFFIPITFRAKANTTLTVSANGGATITYTATVRLLQMAPSGS